MTTATNDQPWHAKCPNWVLPALVCGGAPSLLMLLAACVALVVWMFSGGSEPDVVQAAANPPADVAPAAVPPSADPAPTIREVASAAMPDVPPSDAPTAQEVAAAASAATAPAATDSGSRNVQIFMMPHPGNVNLPMTIAKDYTYDDNTGRLGILGPWEKAVGFIDVDEQRKGGFISNVKHVQLRGDPHGLMYQELPGGDGVFAIAQSKTNGIIFVNSESLEIVKSLRLDDWPVFVTTADDQDAKYMYFSTAVSSGRREVATRDGIFKVPEGWDGKAQRIDLVSMDLDTRFQGEEFQTSTIRSVSGQLAYFYYGLIYFSHDRRYFTQEDRVFANDDGRLLTQLSFKAQWFLSDNVLITGISNTEIVVGSINDGRIVASVSLPDVYNQMLGSIRESADAHVFAKIFIDPQRQLLVVGRLQHVIIIPIETLGLREEPILLLDEPPPQTVALREQYEFPLRTVSGEGSFALVESPEGMTLQDGVIRWRPEVAYTAPLEVKVKTSFSDITREESWTITVE